jgi:hypothetical protein
MQRLFDESPEGEMTQVDFWTLYKDAFAVYGIDKLMRATDLIREVPTVFPGAKAKVIPGDDEKPTRYVIRGLERKRVAVETSSSPEPSTLVPPNDDNKPSFEERFNQLFLMLETIVKQQALLSADHARLMTELATARVQDQESLSVVWTYLNETVPRVEKSVEAVSKKVDVLGRGMSQVDKRVSVLSGQTREVGESVRGVQQTLHSLSKSGEYVTF